MSCGLLGYSEVRILLPGSKLNISATNYRPIRQMQLVRWTGTTWQLFGKR